MQRICRLLLAGISMEITSCAHDFGASCKDYLTDCEPEIRFTMTAQDILQEEAISKAEAAFEGIDYPGFSSAVLEKTAIYRKIAALLPAYDGLVMHGCVVAVDGRAFIFVAKSGTGKTTHARLWLKNIHNAMIVNGDKPILRLVNGVPMAFGTPWMGKEGYGCNTAVPVAGICLLERGQKNAIRPVLFSEVLPQIISACHRPQDRKALLKTIGVLDRIGKATRFYQLSCNMEDEAAFVAYDALCEQSCVKREF